ncbi:uncharacterized protein LOC111026801 isoform X2 [Myzus persicae]|uniref:uncharacterized protein LOC111026801 isoform X2 n=1 Tax=Myzus persicae TaxID=13164 RepID=UPI000B930BFA|nr:uncharacterized protein LOC111026801 isoform X2 [Myzus persicae]
MIDPDSCVSLMEKINLFNREESERSPSGETDTDYEQGLSYAVVCAVFDTYGSIMWNSKETNKDILLYIAIHLSQYQNLETWSCINNKIHFIFLMDVPKSIQDSKYIQNITLNTYQIIKLIGWMDTFI